MSPAQYFLLLNFVNDMIFKDYFGQVKKFLNNIKFENCRDLENVQVSTQDLIRLFYPTRYEHLQKGKY